VRLILHPKEGEKVVRDQTSGVVVGVKRRYAEPQFKVGKV